MHVLVLITHSNVCRTYAVSGEEGRRTKPYNDPIDHELFYKMSNYSAGIEDMTVDYFLRVSWKVRKLLTQWTPASYMTQGQWCLAHTKNTLTSHRKRPEWSREQPSRYRGYCGQESWADPQPFDPPFFAFGVTYLLATYPCQVGVLLPFYLCKRKGMCVEDEFSS